MAEWEELRGAREEDDQKPNHMDYICTFTSASTATKPLLGQSTLFQICGNANFDSTGMDGDVVALRSSRKVNATEGKSHIRVIFRSWYTM